MTLADPDFAEPAGGALEELNKPAWIFKTEQ